MKLYIAFYIHGPSKSNSHAHIHTNSRLCLFLPKGPFDLASINDHCQASWGVQPRVHHSFVQYGGVEAAGEATNIVFSNGLLDPWSVFGVTRNVSSRGIETVIIPNVSAHWTGLGEPCHPGIGLVSVNPATLGLLHT